MLKLSMAANVVTVSTTIIIGFFHVMNAVKKFVKIACMDGESARNVPKVRPTKN